MTKQKFRSLGFDIELEVPSSVEEFDTNAKKVGACLAEAINNVVYRGGLAEFRKGFLHGVDETPATADTPAIPGIEGLEKVTGIDRATKPVMKDGKPVIKDGEPVTAYSESEADYTKRVIAQLVESGKYPSEEAAVAHFQELANQIAASIKFDASATESKASGPKKLAQKYKITAARILANNTVEKANANYLSKIGKTFTATNDHSKMFKATYDVVGADGKVSGQNTVEVSDKDAEALGWLLKAYQDWKAQQELNEL